MLCRGIEVVCRVIEGKGILVVFRSREFVYRCKEVLYRGCDMEVVYRGYV